MHNSTGIGAPPTSIRNVHDMNQHMLERLRSLRGELTGRLSMLIPQESVQPTSANKEPEINCLYDVMQEQQRVLNDIEALVTRFGQYF